MIPMSGVAETHVTCRPDIRPARRTGGVPGAESWEVDLSVWQWLRPAGLGARVLAKAGGGVRPAGRGSGNWGFHMTTIVALLKDKAGVSSIKMALMIGLSSSAVLVLVRIGVAAAGQ